MSKNVYVFAEQRDGVIQKVAYELIGKAKELATDLEQEVVAVVLGNGIQAAAAELFKYGADQVIAVDAPVLGEYSTEPYTKALKAIIDAKDPEIVIYGATAIGRDLAPRVSARVHTGLTADCTKLEINPETKLLEMTRPAFGGNIMATILCADYRPQMATVRPGVMQALANVEKVAEIEKFDVEFTAADMNVEICEIVKTEQKAVDITEAKILVSGGRGVGGPEGFEPLKALAEALIKNGLKLVSGGTDNHLILLDLRSFDISGKELEKRLDEVHITTNKNTIPNDPASPFVTSGLRIGTAAVTSRGFKEDEMLLIAKWIKSVITDFEGSKEQVTKEVISLCEKFPIYK